MVATDQNSSMISMMKDSLKKKGEDREPTYDEIVEAKIVLARSLGSHCSGLLVDGYYGYWNSVASFAIPPATGVLDPRREVRRRKEQARRPAGGARTRLERRQDQAVRGRRGQAAGPVRADRDAIRPSTSSRSCR